MLILFEGFSQPFLRVYKFLSIYKPINNRFGQWVAFVEGKVWGTAGYWSTQKMHIKEMRVSGMLIRYKKSCEKIAMGLLSFMPIERDLKKLKRTMKNYEENPASHLYLWKKGEDFIGLIGIEVDEASFTVHHISVMPSFRGEGVGRAMVERIQQMMQPLEMQATEETQAFIAFCQDKRESFR